MKELLKDVSDKELVEICYTTIRRLCASGGKTFQMCVPPHANDTDIIFYELIQRFEKLIKEDE